MSRPKAALAMWSGVEAQVLSNHARAELASLTELVAPGAIDLNSLDADLLAQLEILIGSWGCNLLDASLLDRMPKLAFLAYAAGSIKSTVTEAFWERGVRVSSAAAANAIPVAEFTFAAIVMIAKDVFGVRDRYREVRGREPVVGNGPGGHVGTRGLKIGIIGASTIGRLLIERLRTLDVRLAVSDPYLDDDAAAELGVERLDLDELFAWSDVVSVHAPELTSTHHLVTAARLGRMHDGAWIINTARGSIVDTGALTRECVAGRLCAFIDTSDPEPLPMESQLYDLPNVVLTPHIAGSQGAELARMGDLSIAEVRRFMRGERLCHEVLAEHLEKIA
jgi:phosphoglycerate dehydrogenase-like enzyme